MKGSVPPPLHLRAECLVKGGKLDDGLDIDPHHSASRIAGDPSMHLCPRRLRIATLPVSKTMFLAAISERCGSLQPWMRAAPPTA